MPTHALRHKRSKSLKPAQKRAIEAAVGKRRRFVRRADYKSPIPQRVEDLPPPQKPEETTPLVGARDRDQSGQWPRYHWSM